MTYAPDTLKRTRIWIDQAPCAGRPNLFDPPDHATLQDNEAQAKKICRTCPVKRECLDAAMDEEGNSDQLKRAGIRGGLTPTERVHRYRTQATAAATDQTMKDAVEKLLRAGWSNPKIAEACGSSTTTVRRIRDSLGIPPVNPPTPIYATHAEAFAARATQVDGGHLDWSGSPYIKVRGKRYTANRWAFQQAHGRAPEGRVLARCGRAGCTAGGHLTDRVMREACGTVGGYAKHHQDRTPPCRPCVNANADADRRLRNTGTTKVLAA